MGHSGLPPNKGCCYNISKAYVQRPCVIFFSGITLLLLLSIPASEMANFSEQSSHEYTVTDSDPSREFDTATEAMNVVDPLKKNEDYKPRSLASQQWGTWTNTYEWSPSQTKTLFTPQTLQQICSFEQTMFNHVNFSDFCIIDYENNFGRGKDACVPPSMTPTRLFYETQILDCGDYMSRLFLAMNTSNTTNPNIWLTKDLAEKDSNCKELAERSTQPLVMYMPTLNKVYSTPSVLGLPSFLTTKSNPSTNPPCLLPASTVVPITVGNTVQNMNAIRNDTSCELYIPSLQNTVVVKNPGVWASGIANDDYKFPTKQNIFNYSSCPLLDVEHVNAVNEYLMTMLQKKDLGKAIGNIAGEDLFGFFFSVDSLEKGYTTRSRTFYSLGAPLSPYKDEADQPAMQRSKYMTFLKQIEDKYMDRFNMKYEHFPNSMPKSAYRTSAIEDGVKFEFYGLVVFNKEFERMMNGDLPMVSLAVLFVYGYITFHTGSFFLSSFALLQIILSLPVSYTVYKYVWGIPFFSQLHILAIFLVLGVGADDVFVLADAWKESYFTVKITDSGDVKASDIMQLEYKRKRIQFAYERAAIAVFNTSFTTAMAFVSTGISPIMSIATFGWFAATCIIMNYVLTVTWFPSVIMVKELYIDPLLKNKCSCSSKEDKDTDNNKKKELLMETSVVVRCFRDCYVPTMTYKVGTVYVVSLGIVIATSVYAIQAAYFTTLLNPPSSSEQFFPADHMFTGLSDRMTDNYMGGSDSSYTRIGYMFGAIPNELDRSKFNQYYPDDNRGVIKWDDTFDIYPKENQLSLVNFCENLKEKVCIDVNDGKTKLSGCTATGSKFVKAGSLECFITEFQDWHKKNYNEVETWDISRQQFEDRLFTFRRDTKPKNNKITGSWKTQIGFVNKKLKFVRISFLSSLVLLHGVSAKKPVYLFAKKVANDFTSDAPVGLKHAFPEGPLFGFVWMTSQEGFVNGLLTGLAICFPIAFVVLWGATGNIILAIYATVAIGSVVCSVLGFCHAMMGWALGVAESVAGIIVIGFSVDYIVHMAHMYTEAEEKTGATSRIDRFTYAAEKMGGTIIGGAITTSGSGCMMFFCQMVFFFKMGLLVCMTILFSVIYSLGFFMALCVLIGPENDVGNTRVMFQRWFGNGKTATAVVHGVSVGNDQKTDKSSNEESKENPTTEVEMSFTNEHFKHTVDNSDVTQKDIIV